MVSRRIFSPRKANPKVSGTGLPPPAGGCTLVDVTALLSIGEFATVTHLSREDAAALPRGRAARARARRRALGLPLLLHGPDPVRPDHPALPRPRHAGPRHRPPARRRRRRTRRLDQRPPRPARTQARRHHRGRRRTATPARTGPAAPPGRPPARPGAAGHGGQRRSRQRRDPGLVRRGHGRDRRRRGRRGCPAGRAARRSVRQRPVHPRLRPRHRVPPDRRRRARGPRPPARAPVARTRAHRAPRPPRRHRRHLRRPGHAPRRERPPGRGPVHETYLVGPRDTDDRSAWRTEIGWPVFTTTAPGSSRQETAGGED